MLKKILFFIIPVLLISCNSRRCIIAEVPVETIKTEYIQQIKKDSIYIHDSINMYIKGDTIFKDKIKTYYKYVFQKDTICKIDSIPVIVKVPEIIEVNKLSWYQKFFIYIGVIVLIIIIIKLGFNKLKWIL